MPFGKKEWYKSDRFKGSIPDIFRHSAVTSSTTSIRAVSDPGIRIKLNDIDFDVPENGTPGGITAPKIQEPMEEVRHPRAAKRQPAARDPVIEADKPQRDGSADTSPIVATDDPSNMVNTSGKSTTCKDKPVEITIKDQASNGPSVSEARTMESDSKVKPAAVTVEDEDMPTPVEDIPICSIMLTDPQDHAEPEREPLAKQESPSAEQFADPAKKKKNRKRNNASQRGPTALNKIRGTGFEDGYADPPMTVEEFEEEKRIYDPRIEECIQRYRGRRRLDSTRDLMFSRYLNMGGIDTSQRQFTGANGISKEDLAGLSKAEKRMAAANDVINRRGDDPRWFTPGDEGWTVDFAGVVAAYLSTRLPFDVAGEQDMMALGVDTILNFINYVIKHDVCPEYEADLARARAVCKLAKIEFPLINRALAGGMGQFNYACRTIFNLSDETDCFVDRMSVDPARNRPVRPILVFTSTLTLLADMYPAARTIDLHKLRDEDPTMDKLAGAISSESRADYYEVVETREPSEPIARLFRALHSGDKVTGHYKPAGVLVVRRCIVEDGFANTPKLHMMPLTRGKDDVASFIVDRDLLRCLLPGMNLHLETARITHPDFELTIVKNLLDVQPSFRLFLPRMLMLDYKMPRENLRDAPSVDNPDVEGGGDGDVEN
uniref:Argonaute siRNA chaperone complex subunit Arb1 n=1 Tax=Pyricularia oryzae (strain P131) TaxID=1143193 RepID=L7ITA2_PYRO1